MEHFTHNGHYNSGGNCYNVATDSTADWKWLEKRANKYQVKIAAGGCKGSSIGHIVHHGITVHEFGSGESTGLFEVNGAEEFWGTSYKVHFVKDKHCI